MKSLLCLVALLSVLSLCNCDYPDFYWRPYNGIIPVDALIAAVDNHRPVYIGAGPVHPHGLIVGAIVPGYPNMTVTTYPKNGNYVYNLTKYINILCSRRPERFHWVVSKFGKDFQKVPGQFIVGGYEYNSNYPDGYPLHVARTKRDGVQVIGKACPWPTYFGYMYYHHAGEEVRIESGYETLIYKSECACMANRDDTIYNMRSDLLEDSNQYTNLKQINF